MLRHRSICTQAQLPIPYRRWPPWPQPHEASLAGFDKCCGDRLARNIAGELGEFCSPFAYPRSNSTGEYTVCIRCSSRLFGGVEDSEDVIPCPQIERPSA